MAYKKKGTKKTKVAKPKADSQSQADAKCYSVIDGNVQDSIAHTAKWSQNQEKWQKLRMRIKKSKTFPFVGCSNIRMPTGELYIRKHKAALYQAAFGIRPIVNAIPSPSGNWQTANKIEKFIDHLVMDVMKYQKKGLITIDQTLEKGFYLNKPYWRTEIVKRIEKFKLEDLKEEELALVMSEEIPLEQKVQAAIQKLDIDTHAQVYADNVAAVGKAINKLIEGKDVEFETQDVIYDFPDVALVSPERCYVPTDSGIYPQSTQFMVHEYFLPFRTVQYNAQEEGWDKQAVNEIGEYKGLSEDDKKLTDVQKETREGIELINSDSELVRIWEYYGWYDIDGDDVPENSVITVAPDFGKVFRKIMLPFNSGQRPFVRFNYEVIDDRWFSSRGLIEIIEDIIKEIDVQHMQKIDNQTIRNAPMFVYRAGMVNPNTVTFMPNGGIPVNGMNPLRDTIDVLNNNNPNVEYSYEREQMLLESKVGELVGQIDFTLQSMINKRQPRTLGEVNLQSANTQTVFSLDVAMFIESLSELMTWIWDLWCQYGNDEYEFSYFGQEGWEKIRLTKEETQGGYKIKIRGNDQNTNPAVKLQKAQQILMATTNEAYLQSGVITSKEMANGLKRFYQELDVEGWEELVNQNPQTPPPPPPGADIKVDYEDMTDGEQAQVLAGRNIKPDVEGRRMKKMGELADKAIEARGKAQ